MRYVNSILVPEERVLVSGRYAWVRRFLGNLLGLVLSPVLGIGLVILVICYIENKTLELVVTNKRLIYKRGWISRRTEEIQIERIGEVNLEQSVLGRLLGYGRLKVSGVGFSSIALPAIDDPIGFRRALDHARLA